MQNIQIVGNRRGNAAQKMEKLHLRVMLEFVRTASTRAHVSLYTIVTNTHGSIMLISAVQATILCLKV